MQIKNSATNSREKTGVILSQNLLAVGADLRAQLPTCDSMRRNIRRYKRGSVPKEPASAKDIHLTEEFTTTGGAEPKPFLIYDNGSEATKRILIFATEDGLRTLCRSREWFVDGTFSVAPRQFKQMFIVRVPLGQRAVTCIYGFLPKKSQSVYEEFFQAVVESCAQLGFDPDPATVLIDFEQAISNAIHGVISPHVHVRRCFYHLCQATWRKIQELGLTDLYKEDEEFRHFASMIDSLAFLPIADVEDGIVYLESVCPDAAQPLLAYFDTTFVRGGFRRIPAAPNGQEDVPAPVLIRRTPPLYEPHTWNQHDTTLRNESRTNNFCEGWNNSFRQRVGHDHPSLWLAIECIQQDAVIVCTEIDQEARGQLPPPRKRKATENLQKRLKALCVSRVAGDKSVSDALRGFGHNVRVH